MSVLRATTSQLQCTHAPLLLQFQPWCTLFGQSQSHHTLSPALQDHDTYQQRSAQCLASHRVVNLCSWLSKACMSLSPRGTSSFLRAQTQKNPSAKSTMGSACQGRHAENDRVQISADIGETSSIAPQFHLAVRKDGQHALPTPQVPQSWSSRTRHVLDHSQRLPSAAHEAGT